MIRVAWLFEYPTLHGGERSLLATLGGVRAAGWEPWAVAPGAGPLADALAAQGIELAPFECRGGDGRRRPLDALRGALGDLLAARRHDLVHANSLSMGRLAGPVARGLGLRAIAHLRDIVGLSAAAVGDLAANDRLLAVSAAARDYHVAQGLPAAATHVLHNGVDLSLFRPRPATGALHAELGLPRDALLAGSVGQLVLRKGQDVLLRAAADVLGRRAAGGGTADLHWVLVGESRSVKDEARAYVAQLRATAARPPLAARVHFLGPRGDVADLLPEFDLVVHAARQEPLSRVLLEAAAAGRAIVATDVGGTREIFPAGAGAAVLVPVDDPAALAEAVARLAAAPRQRAALGAAARRRAEEAFDIAHAAARLARHYGQVLAAG